MKWGDKIRAMSDEELAEWLAIVANCPEEYNEIGACERQNEACTTCWLDWLKSPVEVEK